MSDKKQNSKNALTSKEDHDALGEKKMNHVPEKPLTEGSCYGCSQEFCKKCYYCFTDNCDSFKASDNKCEACKEYRNWIKSHSLCNNCGLIDKCKECSYCTNPEHFSIDMQHASDCSKYYKNVDKEEMDSPIINYTKLKNGTWAIASLVELKIGYEYVITKKNGDTTIETVEKFHGMAYGKYIYTIKEKYKKGGYSPKTAPEGYNKKSKTSISSKYNMYVWKLNEKFEYDLVSEIAELSKEAIETFKEYYIGLNQKKNGYILFAQKIANTIHDYSNLSSDILLGSESVIDSTFAKYKAIKKAEAKKEMKWLMCNMVCSDFPAKAQKIKGIHDLASKLSGMVSTSKIYNAVVVSENLDIMVDHEHYSSYGYNPVGRVKLETVIEHMLNHFCRPAPPSPEHGFVDSRLITTEAEAKELIDEIRKTGYSPEIIIMPKIECDYSGVITPDSISFGAGNDGATSGGKEGKKPFYMPLQLDKAAKKKYRELFWTNEEKMCYSCSKTYHEYDSGECSCGGQIGFKNPFVELLYEPSKNKPTIVQLRSGPFMDVVEEKVKVKYVVEVTSDMDLIEWGVKAKQITSDIEVVEGQEYKRVVPVVYHLGGAPTTHFAIHCKSANLPYITDVKPSVGDVILVGSENPTNLDALRAGLVMGMETDLGDIHENGRHKAEVYLRNFLAATHAYAIADTGIEEVAQFIGYSWAIGARIIAAFPMGESRHREQPREAISKVVDDVWKANFNESFCGCGSCRGNIFTTSWKLDIERLIKCLVISLEGFEAPIWNGSYGGHKWAECTRSLLDVFVAIRDFLKTHKDENFQALVNKTNEMVNLAHNGGWWLNKLLSSKNEMDNAALLPHFMFHPELAFKMREDAKKYGKMGIKVRAFDIAKMIRYEELYKAGVLGLEKVEEVKAEGISTLKDIETYSQPSIYSWIVSGVSIKAQYYCGKSSIHVQVKSYEINRPYGYVENFELYFKDMIKYKEYFNKVMAAGNLVSSLIPDSKNKYASIIIHKSKKEGFVILQNYDWLVMVESQPLYAHIEEIMEWQNSTTPEPKNVSESVKLDLDDFLVLKIQRLMLIRNI
jgi:hypothetical protein